MRINDNHWLKNTPIAHRGLWGKDIKENSITAYKNAVQNGFAIEVDLYASTDGELFCFHDVSLERMTGKEGYIFDKDSAFIKSLFLKDSKEKIPTFRDLLFIVNGKVPILIEIKDQPDKQIVERVLCELDEYQGEFAIQSFNPFHIIKVKKIAPYVIRGILSTKRLNFLPPIKRFIVKNMALNFLAKPDFISYDIQSFPIKKSKIKNKTVLAWTIDDQQKLGKAKTLADNVIFELI